MNHSFDIQEAAALGVDGAIMVENFRFWIAKNRANKRHFYDGQWWTYNSVKAFCELFPYWSAPQIRRTLDKLETAGVLVSGHFGQNGYDRTKWYALNEHSHLLNSANGFVEKSKSLISTDTYTDKAAQPSGFAEFWELWPKSERKQSKSKCLQVWVKQKLSTHQDQILRHVAHLKTTEGWTKQNGQFIPSPLAYLNQQRWDGAEIEEPPALFAGAI